MTKHEIEQSIEEIESVLKFLNKTPGSEKQIKHYKKLKADLKNPKRFTRRCGGLV